MSHNFDLKTLLRLCSIPKIGSQRIRKLISFFGSPDTVMSSTFENLIKVEGIDRKLAHLIRKGGDSEFASNQMRLLNLADAKVVSFWDDDYLSLIHI